MNDFWSNIVLCNHVGKAPKVNHTIQWIIHISWYLIRGIKIFGVLFKALCQILIWSFSSWYKCGFFGVLYLWVQNNRVIYMMSCKKSNSFCCTRFQIWVLVSPQPETWRCPVEPVFTEWDQRYLSVFVTRTGWRGERCKIHLICCDSGKDDSLMMFLKCKSPQKYPSHLLRLCPTTSKPFFLSGMSPAGAHLVTERK